MEQHIFGVTEVNHLVKLLLDSEPMLQNISVRGELSNYKIYHSRTRRGPFDASCSKARRCGSVFARKTACGWL